MCIREETKFRGRNHKTPLLWKHKKRKTKYRRKVRVLNVKSGDGKRMQVKMRDEKKEGGQGEEVGQGLWEGREGR